MAEPAQGTPRLSLAGRALIGFGVLVALLLGYEVALSGLYQQQSQRSLLASFKQEVPTRRLDSPAALAGEGDPVALLRIDRIHLEQMVVEGSSPSDLRAGPGHLRVSPLPGEHGNAVILGRRLTYGGPFGELFQLRTGDRITVTTGQGSFTYRVASRGWAGPQDVEAMAATRDDLLTLVTSEPVLEATRRYYVRARLVGDPLAVASRPPAGVVPAELGLAGDAGGLLLALVAGQLLLGAGWVAWRQRRTWPPAVLYMLAAPVLVALAVVAFSSFDAILPGTL